MKDVEKTFITKSSIKVTQKRDKTAFVWLTYVICSNCLGLKLNPEWIFSQELNSEFEKNVFFFGLFVSHEP